MQTAQKEKVTLIQMGVRVVKTDGILGLYNGLSASVLRQVCCVLWLQVSHNMLYYILIHTHTRDIYILLDSSFF